MKTILLFIFCILVVHTAKAETITIKFEDLPHLITSKNGNVLAAESLVKGAASQKGHLKRSYLPNIKASTGFESFKTDDLDVLNQPVAQAHADINLLRGGKDNLENKIIEKKHSLAQNSLKKTYLETLFRARLLYADILFYEEELKHVKSSHSLNNSNIKRVQKQIEAGSTTPTDKLVFTIQANQLKQDQLLFEEDLEHAIQELKTVLGLDPSRPIKITQPLLSTSEKMMTNTLDFKNHPEVSQLNITGQILDLQTKQQQSWWIPALDTYGLYALHPYRERERTPTSKRDEYVLGVNLSLHLFDGLQSHTKSKELKFESLAKSQAMNQKSKELTTQFEKWQHELKTRKQLIKLLNQNITDNKKYMELSLDEFSRGVKTSSQLFEASEQLYNQKRKLSETKREFIKILSTLLVLQGK